MSLPSSAQWKLDTNEDIMNTRVCSGNMSLLLPVALSQGSTKDQLGVFFMERIIKRIVTVGDILNKIYHFYNVKSVLPEDLIYISVPDPDLSSEALQTYYQHPASLHQTKFIDFVGRTFLKRLLHQEGNVYSVELSDSMDDE